MLDVTDRPIAAGADAEVIDCTSLTLLALYLRGVGTISGGTIQLEEASEPDYAGTWSPIGAAINANTLSGGKELTTHLAVGAYAYIRVREATAVSGGGTATFRAAGVSYR